jgi:tryptophan-rich sensory protein
MEDRAFENDHMPVNPGGWPLLALAGFIGLGLLAGAVGGGITAANLPGWYAGLVHPPGTPPNTVFAPVWTVLYVLMGTAAWLVWRHPAIGQRAALKLWGWQLLVNAAWTPAFFGLHSPGLGLAVLALLLVLIGLTLRAFRRQHPLAAALLVPYLLWSCYAFYLNAGFAWLNPG